MPPKNHFKLRLTKDVPSMKIIMNTFNVSLYPSCVAVGDESSFLITLSDPSWVSNSNRTNRADRSRSGRFYQCDVCNYIQADPTTLKFYEGPRELGGRFHQEA